MRIPTWCSLLAASTFAGALACGEVSFPVIPAEEFTATLTGANEVPAVTTTTTGTAVFGVINDTILTFRVDVAGMDSTTASHIHEGAAGVVGPVIVTLFTGPTACLSATGTPINVASPRCRTGFTGPLNQAQVKYSALTQLPAGYGVRAPTPITPADTLRARSDTMRARFDSLLVLMRTGGVYVNAHNLVNPGGHVRGPIGPRP